MIKEVWFLTLKELRNILQHQNRGHKCIHFHKDLAVFCLPLLRGHVYKKYLELASLTNSATWEVLRIETESFQKFFLHCPKNSSDWGSQEVSWWYGVLFFWPNFDNTADKAKELTSCSLHWEYLLDKFIPTEITASVQFSRSVMSDSLWPHELQQTWPPCPSPTPGVHSKSCPLSWWCHPAVSFSIVPFSSCPQSLPASETFPMSQLFAWGGQSTGVSALASFRPKTTQKSQPRWVVFYSIIWPRAKVPGAPFRKGSINTSVWRQIFFKDATHSRIFRFRASDCLTSVHKLKPVFLVLSHLNHLDSKVS